MTKLENQLAKARRIVAFVDARDVHDQARTYSDAEWREMATQADERSPSDETIAICRALLAERQGSTLPPIDRERARRGFVD